MRTNSHDDQQGDHDIARGDGEPDSDNDRAQVQRVAHVRIRARRRQLFILVHVP